MPIVDFTLEDVRGLMREELVAERKHTQEIVATAVDELREELTAQLGSFIEHNFEPAIESLQEQIDGIRHDMKRLRVVVDTNAA